MNKPSTGPRYLIRWDHSRDQRLGRDVLVTAHRLAELPLFADEGIAELLDRYPRHALQLTTMGDNPAFASQLQTGQLQHHGGLQWVDMIRRGRLCLRLKQVAKHHEGLRRIVGRLFSEMMECQPGLRTSDHDGDLEISSPAALTYYRFDIKPNVFWQIRGRRTVLAYPCREPFVHTPTLEEKIACGSQTPLYFEPAFDDHAIQFPQTSGDVFSCPQHTPYRIVNDQHLNVTLTTSYMTRESRRRNEIRCANHVLNRWLPRPGRSERTVGPKAIVKRALCLVAGTRRVESWEMPAPTFRVDPHAPLCIGSLPSPSDASNPKISTLPDLRFQTTTSAFAESEN